jgi:hypothetical protein
MTPTTYPLAIYQGDTYRWQFVLWSDAEKTIPVDLTGAEVKAEIRDKPGGNIQTTLDLVVTLPNIIDATLDAAASHLLKKGVWDLQVTFASGDVSTFLAGAVTITADVTDSTMTPARLRIVS